MCLIYFMFGRCMRCLSMQDFFSARTAIQVQGDQQGPVVQCAGVQSADRCRPLQL